ncbi:MAG: PorV/PorQ family protein [Candidatus Firestonebacteria bacterium]
MFKKICISVISFFFVGQILYASAGTSALPFLRIAPSARAVGMGETFVSVADDVNASFWNPAGLANLKTMDLSLMHLIYWDNSSYEFLAFNYPLTDNLKIGTHIIYLNYGSIDKTTETDSGTFNGVTGTFTPYDLAVAGSIGYSLLEDLQIGLNIKYVMQSIDTDTANALAGDIGALCKLNMLVENLVVGLAVSNIGTKIKEDSLPMTLRAGLSMRFSILQEKDLLAAAGVYLPFESSVIAENVGVEYWYDHMFAVRLGYKVGYDVGNFTAGIGFKSILEGIFGYQIDYSYAPSGNLGDTHRISVTLNFGEEETATKGKSKNPGIRTVPLK